MKGLYPTTGGGRKRSLLWEKKVIDPLEKIICKQKIRKKNLHALKF